MKLATALCSALLLAGGCDSQVGTTAPGGGIALDLAALNLQDVASVTYTVTVKDAADADVSTATVSSANYAVGGDPTLVRYVAPCDASGTGASTVVVTMTALMVGTTAVTTLPPAQTQTATCIANVSTPVSFSFYAMASSEMGFFDIVVGTNLIYCSAKLDCTDNTGGASLFFPASSKGGLVLGLVCTADNTNTVNTVLHMSNIVIDCGSSDIVTIDPDASGNLPAGNITGTTGYIDAVTVFRGEDQVGTTADNLYWNVSIGLTSTIMSHTCTLKAQATTTIGVSVPINAPYVDWTVPITGSGSAVTCTSNALNAGGSGVTSAWPTEGSAEAFAHTYNPTP